MRPTRYLFLLVYFFIFSTVVLTQNNFLPPIEVISAANLEQLEQIAMFHRGTIEEMTWSPDSTLLATGGSAGGWIYKQDDLQSEPIHFAKYMSVSDLDFHPSGNYIITAEGNNSVHEWDSHTGELIREISPNEYDQCPLCNSYVNTVKYSPSGDYIAIGANIGTLLLDSSSLEVLSFIPEGSYELFFSPDGQYIAAKLGMRGGEINIWSIEDLQNGRTEAKYAIREFPSEVWNITWVQNSDVIIAGLFDYPLYSYELDTETLSQFSQGGSTVTASSDFVATVEAVYDDETQDWEYFLDLLDISTGQRVHRFEAMSSITDLRFSPDGRYIAASAASGSILLWEIETERLVNALEGTGAAITAISLLSDYHLVSLESEFYEVDTAAGGGGCGDNTLRIWDLQRGIEINSWRASTANFGNFYCGILASIENSDQVLLQQDNNLLVLNPFTGDSFSLTMPFQAERPYHFFSFKLSSDSSLLGIRASSYYQQDEIFVWDVSNGLTPQSHALQAIVPDFEDIADFTFSPNSESLILTSRDGYISEWNISMGSKVRSIEWDIPQWIGTMEIAMSPDDLFLAINVGTGIYFMETETYTTVDIWRDRDFGTGEDIAFGRSDSWLVTKPIYGHHRFWIDERNSSFYLPARAEEILFSSDGTFIVTGGMDGSVRIWGIPIAPVASN